MTERVPDPLEWHPAYARMTDLLDWLNGVDYADKWTVLVPRPQRLAAMYAEPDDLVPVSAAFPVHTLTKRKCWGGAPYVGRPFRYMWMVATDELGRAIAGDSWRFYNPADDFGRWPDYEALPER